MKTKFNQKYVQPASMKLIALGKKYVSNTWVHKLPITEWAYRRIFYLGREIGEATIPFRNALLTVHTKDISMVPALINNNFEEFELELFETLIQPGDIVIDIGANIGVYSLVASAKAGRNGRIFSFEPVPENFTLLEKNLDQNKIKNVAAINKAVGNFDGEIKMEIEKDSLATHHISENPLNPLAVQVTTLDGFMKAEKLKFVDVIKMDIEGYEGYALEGALKVMGNKKTKLLTEFSADFVKRSGKDPLEVANILLRTFRYCYFVDEKEKRLTLIESVDDLLDYRKTNFLLLHSKLK